MRVFKQAMDNRVFIGRDDGITSLIGGPGTPLQRRIALHGEGGCKGLGISDTWLRDLSSLACLGGRGTSTPWYRGGKWCLSLWGGTEVRRAEAVEKRLCALRWGE